MKTKAAPFEKTKKQPLHEQVREHLRQQCLETQHDVALPTLRQMSETLGVNHITVSRALRELEAEGLVKVIPGKGTFVTRIEPAHQTIELLRLCTQIGGLLETSLHTFKGMQERLHEGLSLSINTLSMPPVPRADAFLQSARMSNTAALAIFDFEYLSYPDSFLEAQFIHELSEQLPVVLVGKEHNMLKLDCVYCDPAPQMTAFLEECYAKGLRSFGYVGVNYDHHHLRHRQEAFKDFLLKHGLTWQTSDQNTDPWHEIQYLLKLKPQVIVASDPWNATKLVVEAQQKGLMPGIDVHILCFAGSIEQVRAIAPYVSVILLEEEEVGRCIINRIQNRLAGTDKPPPVTRRIPGKLVRQGKSSA